MNCNKGDAPRPTNKKGRQRFLRRLIPYGGKDSVKENRQGCLSRFIRAQTNPLRRLSAPLAPNKKDAIWRLFYLVGMTGFEPATSASRTQRSTKLSHASIFMKHFVVSQIVLHYIITSFSVCPEKFCIFLIFLKFQTKPPKFCDILCVNTAY